MAGSIFVRPKAAPISGSGAPYAGAKYTFYLTGTSTLATVYTDSALSVAHSNPVIADANGTFAPIWLDPTKTYRAKLTTAANVLIEDIDPVDNKKTDAAVVAFTQSGTGAITTTVQAKFGETVSVKDFGAVGDGTADDTAAITAALAAANNVILVAGDTYKISGITIPASHSLGCPNGRANITTTTTSITAFTIATNDIQLYGVNINGGSPQSYQGGGTSAGSGYGITISGAAGAVYNINISDVDVKWCNNTAINVGVTAATSSYGKSVSFVNVRAYENRTNWFFGSSAEYIESVNCHGTLGHYGIRQGGGNNKVVNSNFENNYYNCYLETATNQLHGGFYGCSFNHANYRSLYATGVTLGHEFVGCKFWYGSIEIVNCYGIRICNGQMASNSSVFIIDGTSGGLNWIHDNMVYGTYTKTFTSPRVYWARNQLVGDFAATTKEDFVPQYYARANLGSTGHYVNTGAPGSILNSITGTDAWLYGISNLTDTFSSYFFAFKNAGLYQVNGRLNIKAHTGAAEQKVTLTVRLVNASVVEQSKFVIEKTISATSTGDDIVFSDTFFSQSNWYLGFYINTTAVTNGVDTVSADIVVRSLA